MKYYYLYAGISCKVYKDFEGCQLLANLCVMVMYDESHNACKLYKQLNDGEQLGTEDTGRKKKMPWLYYEADEEKIKFSLAYRGKVAFEENINNRIHYLNFYVAIYNLQGKMIDFKKVSTEFFLCPSSVEDGFKFRAFGVGYTLACNLDMSYFLQLDMKFFELFIEQPLQTGSEGQKQTQAYLAVPIRLMQQVDASGQKPNENGNTRFVRRFTMFDNMAGLKSDINSKKELPEVFRFSSSITLKVELAPKQENQIYLPYFEIETTDKQLNDLQDADGSISYKSLYYFNSSTFYIVAFWILIFWNIILVIYCAYKIYSWLRYNPKKELIIMKVLFTFLEILAEGNFIYLITMSGYWFVFFKFQQEVYLLIPDKVSSFLWFWQDRYPSFDIILFIVGIVKIISLMYFIIQVLKTDVFFVDWEPQLQYMKEDALYKKFMKQGISYWRAIFVANEFNELATIRLISIEFCLFGLGLIMEGLGINNYAQEDPGFSNIDNPQIQKNYVLKFFLTTVILITLGVGQWILTYLLKFKMPLKIEEFIDLCSLANISVFMLDQEIHGYYIHGKTPSGCSEGNLVHIKKNLIMESEQNMSRGITKDNREQCFEIFIPPFLRNTFNKEFKHNRDEKNARGDKGQKLFANPMPKIPENEQKEIDFRKNTMSDLIQTYLKYVQEQSDQAIKKKNMVQRLFNLPPIDLKDINEQDSIPVFFEDPKMGYKNVLFQGIEITLLFFDIIVYSLIDLLFNSTIIAILITYLFDQGICLLRQSVGNFSISQTSMIDDKFLI